MLGMWLPLAAGAAVAEALFICLVGWAAALERVRPTVRGLALVLPDARGFNFVAGVAGIFILPISMPCMPWAKVGDVSKNAVVTKSDAIARLTLWLRAAVH